MTLLLGLITFAPSAQFINGNFEIFICEDECETSNSTMDCIPEWDEFFFQDFNYVQSLNCDETVCEGENSILIQNFNNISLSIFAENPIVPPSNTTGMPEVVTLLANVNGDLSGPGTGIHILGINDPTDPVTMLGFDAPEQTDQCEELTIVLDPDLHTFQLLQFHPALESSVQANIFHEVIIDNIEHAGPLFNITDNCVANEISFQASETILGTDIETIFVEIYFEDEDGEEFDVCNSDDILGENFFLTGSQITTPFTCTTLGGGDYIFRVFLVYDDGETELLDDIIYEIPEECCPAPSPDYVIRDAMGDERYEFCVGEEIHLDAMNSANYDTWYLSIWQLEPGAAGIEDPAAIPGPKSFCRINPDIQNINQAWEPGLIPFPLVLNNIWDACDEEPDFAFEPGFEYWVQLAVNSECAGPGWHVKQDLFFSVNCCEEPSANACFATEDIDNNEDHYTLHATLYDTHENLDAIHEWYIYTEDDAGDPVPEAIIINDEMFFEPAQYGVEYFIIHKVITDCKEECFRWRDSNGFLEEEERRRDDSNICDVGEYINCDIIDNIFPPCSQTVAPTNLQVEDGVLTWDPLQGVDLYVINGQFGGQTSCACDNQFPITFIIGESTTNSIQVPDWLIEECFQWSVQALCSREGISQPSEPACYFPAMFRADNSSIKAASKEIKVSPNPAQNQFKIVNTTTNAVSYELYSINGQLIYSGNIKARSTFTINAETIHAGVYILKVKDQINHNLIQTEKIVIQK